MDTPQNSTGTAQNYMGNLNPIETSQNLMGTSAEPHGNPQDPMGILEPYGNL